MDQKLAEPPTKARAEPSPLARFARRSRRDRRGVVAMEFAMLATAFMSLMLFIIEISYDLYSQEAMDAALHAAVRAIQTGNAQNLANGGSFTSNYVCPSAHGLLLACPSRVYVKIQKMNFTNGSDYYDATTGMAPVQGGAIDLVGGGYLNADGTSTFCNSGPGQFILVSALYLGPSFVGNLFPNVLSARFGGNSVHPTLSTTGVVTESYAQTSAAQGTNPAKPC